MKHVLKIVSTEEMNDTFVAQRFRCCDDPSTDSTCTLALTLTADQVSETLDMHRKKMATLHDQKLKFRAGTHPVNAAAEASVEV
jgi:hypothetical protein